MVNDVSNFGTRMSLPGKLWYIVAKRDELKPYSRSRRRLEAQILGVERASGQSDQDHFTRLVGVD